MRLPVIAAVVLLLITACSRETGTPAVADAVIAEAARGVVTYPLSLDPACRDGRARSYDQCSDQFEIYSAALDKARAENKTLLVIIGAEWCGWCHTFDAHLKGATGRFDHITARKRGDVSAGALALVRYVADNFVVVHIEDDFAPGADDVIRSAGAEAYFQEYYPTIFAVGPDGKFAAKLDHKLVKIQINGLGAYAGYDRALVIKELKRLRAAALRT
jgi:hypothetical protein